MDSANPELLALPFQARRTGCPDFLALDQALHAWRRSLPLLIERSYPGAPYAIGWTIFRRTPRKFLYEGEPLFAFERPARRYLRQVYAVEYTLHGDDLLTYSHLHL
jgi:hypothetical protein